MGARDIGPVWRRDNSGRDMEEYEEEIIQRGIWEEDGEEITERQCERDIKSLEER